MVIMGVVQLFIQHSYAVGMVMIRCTTPHRHLHIVTPGGLLMWAAVVTGIYSKMPLKKMPQDTGAHNTKSDSLVNGLTLTLW